MSVEIVHGFHKDWTESMSVAAGPTTRTVGAGPFGGRAALPQPTPADANAIWLAKNGNDANAGTQALPKLTLAGALAALTGPKPTVHIFRNGFVGDLSFTFSGVIVLNSQHIQVEVGQVATLVGSANPRIELAAGKLNGLYITTTDNTPTSALVQINSGAVAVNNCQIDARYGTLVSPNVYMALAILQPGTGDVSRNVYRGTQCVQIESGTSIILTDSILLCSTYSDSATQTVYRGIGVQIKYVGNTQTTIGRCVIVGAESAFSIQTTLSAVNKVDADIGLIAAYECQYAFEVTSSGSNLRYVNVDVLTSLWQVAVNYISALSPIDTGITISNESPVDPRTPPFYRNYQSGKDGNADGFRLQIEGIAASNGITYGLTSPLKALGMGPWVESATGPVHTYDYNTPLTYPPKSFSMPAPPQNPQTHIDPRGNAHIFHDGLRYKITMDWRGDRHMSAEQLNKLQQILAETGTKRIYFRGVAGNLFDNATEGDWTDIPIEMTINGRVTTVYEFIPDAVLPMIPDHWRGFWLELSTGDEFYIIENDDTTMWVVNKYNNVIPITATYDFAVRYMLIQNEPVQIDRTQEYFSYFEKGGKWAEVLVNDLSAYTWTTASVVFYEVEDPEEGE